MAPSSLLLAHLSDVHLAPMPPMPVSSLTMKRVLGAANWHRHRRHVHQRSVLDALVADLRQQRPDHIVVTGDLVNLGLAAEHAAALQWLRELGPPADVTVVPGNHDAYVRRHEHGYTLWRDYMSGHRRPALADDRRETVPDRDGVHFPFVRRMGPVALIGLGSGVPTLPLVSAGHLGNRQLADLASMLRQEAEAGFARIVAIHHPPHRYGQEWRTGLRDAGALEAVLRREGAEAVVHGHFHRTQHRAIDGPGGPIPIVGVPSASAAMAYKGDLAGYSLLRIMRMSGGAFVIEMTRRGLAEAGGPVVDLGRTSLSAAKRKSTPGFPKG